MKSGLEKSVFVQGDLPASKPCGDITIVSLGTSNSHE